MSKLKRQPGERSGPIGALSQAPYVNAPIATLANIAERIDKGIYSDRTNEETCRLLSAAYKEIIRQRNVIKRSERLRVKATQINVFDQKGES